MPTNKTQTPGPAGPCEPPLTSADAALMPAIVLDTNVVLDWLLFDDPSSVPVAAAITARTVRWIATAAMRGEFAAVLQRGLAAERGADWSIMLASWDAHAHLCDDPTATPRSTRLRCSDPDDQMFVDLACAAGARWLLSRDRAVLRLSRHAAAFGLRIAVPERWSATP